MTPDFSVSVGYVFWLWRYELIFASATAFVLAITIEWTLRRYSTLRVYAQDHEPPNLLMAPHRSMSKYSRGVSDI
jgi:hypothetical protein